MVVVFEYSKTDGSREQVAYEEDVRKIDLFDRSIAEISLLPISSCCSLQSFVLWRNRIQRIDLTPLASCAELEELYLSRNRFQYIDLDPLQSCTKLKQLWLNHNELISIDLSPLSSCISFDTLWLTKNDLQQIDLTPLNSCPRLETLRLDNNRLKKIDLTPLSACIALEELNFDGNQLEQVELSPLRSCRKLRYAAFDSNARQETLLDREHFKDTIFYDDRQLHFNAPARLLSLDAVADLFPLVSGWKTVHLFKEALTVLDLDWLGVVDADVTPLLTDILETERAHARERVLEVLVPLVCKQVDEGRTTLWLDVTRAMTQSTEFVERADLIAQLRLEELQRVRLRQRRIVVRLPPDEWGIEDREVRTIVDLKPLWMTAYGYQVLTALGLRETCSSDTFERVKRAIAEVAHGLQITAGEEEQYPHEIPTSLRNYIIRVAYYNSPEAPEDGEGFLDH